MSVFKLSTKDRIVEVEKLKKGVVSVVVETTGNDGTIATAYYLDSIHYDKLTSYQSLSALVKYAKANQTTRVYPKTNSNSSIRVETSCPRPPETSFDSTVNANANASANDVDGGILYPNCSVCGAFTTEDEYLTYFGQCQYCEDNPELHGDRCECGADWVIGKYFCVECGFESDDPF